MNNQNSRTSEGCSQGSGIRFSTDSVKGFLTGREYTVDSDGDIKTVEPASSATPLGFYLWLMPKGDRLEMDGGEKGLPPDADPKTLLNRVGADHGPLRLYLDSRGKLRVSATLYAKGLSCDEAQRGFNCLYAEIAALWTRVAREAGVRHVSEAEQFKFTTELFNTGGNDITIDSDGDVRQDIDESPEIPFKWFMWYYPRTSYVTLDSGERGIPAGTDLHAAIQGVQPKSNLITIKFNDKGNLRIKATVDRGDYDTRDQVGRALADTMLAIEDVWKQIARRANLRLKTEAEQFVFSTRSMQQLLSGCNITVDSDGDIREDKQASGYVPYSWYIWYYPQGNRLGIDSGERGIPSSIDPYALIRRVNVRSNLIRLEVNNKGNIRIKANIDNSNYRTVAQLGGAMDEVINEIPSIWHQLADAAGLFNRPEPEPAPRWGSSTTYAGGASSSSRSSSYSSSSSSRSSSSSSPRNARPAKADNEPEIRSLESRISDLESRNRRLDQDMQSIRSNMASSGDRNYKLECKKNIESKKSQIQGNKDKIRELKDKIRALR